MQMNLGKIVIIGGVGYLLYSTGILHSLFGIGSPATTAAGGTTTNTSGVPTVTSSGSNPNPPLSSPDTKALVAAYMGGGSQLLSFDQWNYGYKAVRGIDGPPPDRYLSAADRFKLMTINEWWGYMQQGDFSGLGILARNRSIGGYVPMSTYPPQNFRVPTPSDMPGYQAPGGMNGMGYMGMGYMGLGRFIWG